MAGWAYGARHRRGANPYTSPLRTARADLLEDRVTAVEALTGISRFVLAYAVPVGSGFNGTAYRLPAAPAWRAILKLTTDPDEVEAAARALAAGGHPALVRVHLARSLPDGVGVVWQEEARPAGRARDLGIHEAVLRAALRALRARDRRAFEEIASGTPLAPLGDLAEWLTALGIRMRPVDWKRENLGATEDGRIVLLDLGAEVD